MAAPVLLPPLRDGDRLTRDEFMRRWEAMPDLLRAELIDGVVHLPSPVSKPHSQYHLRLSGLIAQYLSATPGCQGGIAGTWLMSNNSVPQPDLDLHIEAQHGGQSRDEGDYPAGAPELIIEISNTTIKTDSGPKLRLYEPSGVREYITVNPRREQIVWRELVEGDFRDMSPDDDGWYRSRVFPGFWLDPAALWNGDFAGLAAAVQRGVATPQHAEFIRRLASRKTAG